MVLLFSYIAFLNISVHSIWLPGGHLFGAPFGNLGKPFTALSVSRAYKFTTEGASEGKECRGRGQEGRRMGGEEGRREGGEVEKRGGGGRWWHYPAQSTQEKDLSLGLLIMC